MYEDLLVALTKSKSRYLVIGAIAQAFHGYVRVTFDLDLLPDMSEENLEKIISVFDKFGYSPRIPVDSRDLKDSEKRKYWFEKKNMKVFSFIDVKNPLNTVDLMIYPPIDFEEAFKRKSIYKIKNSEIYVTSIDDLVTLKKVANRDKDMEDIRVLERLKENFKDA